MRKNMKRILSSILALSCALSVSFAAGNNLTTENNTVVYAADESTAASYALSFGKVKADYSALKSLSDYKGTYKGATLGEGTYKLDDSYADRKVVEVPLTISENSGIFVGNIYFKSDLEFIGCKYVSDEKISTKNSVNVAKPSSNKLLINNDNDVTEEDTITLLFVLPLTVENNKEYTVSILDKTNFIPKAYKDSKVTSVAGSVTVSGAPESDLSSKLMRGDVNLDGKVNPEDGTLILKYFNYTTMITLGMDGTDPIKEALTRKFGDNVDKLLEISLANAKITKDDIINSDDATILLRFFNQKSMNDAFGEEYTVEGLWASFIK